MGESQRPQTMTQPPLFFARPTPGYHRLLACGGDCNVLCDLRHLQDLAPDIRSVSQSEHESGNTGDREKQYDRTKLLLIDFVRHISTGDCPDPPRGQRTHS